MPRSFTKLIQVSSQAPPGATGAAPPGSAPAGPPKPEEEHSRRERIAREARFLREQELRRAATSVPPPGLVRR